MNTTGLEEKYNELDSNKEKEGIQSDKAKMESLVNFILQQVEEKKTNIDADDFKTNLLADLDGLITSMSQDPEIIKSLDTGDKAKRDTQESRDVQFVTALKAIKTNLGNPNSDLSSLTTGSVSSTEGDFGKLAGANYDKFGLDGRIGEKTKADIGLYSSDLVESTDGAGVSSGSMEVPLSITESIALIPEGAKQALMTGLMTNPEMQKFAMEKVTTLIGQLKEGAPLLAEAKAALSVFGIDVSKITADLTVDQIKSLMTLVLKVVAKDTSLNLETELQTLTSTLGVDVSALSANFSPEKITEFMTQCPTLYGCVASSVLDVISSPDQLTLRTSMIPTLQKIVGEHPQLMGVFDAMIGQMKPEETQKFLQVCMQDEALFALMNNEKILDMVLANKKLQGIFMSVVENNNELKMLFMGEVMKHPELIGASLQKLDFGAILSGGFNAVETGEFMPKMADIPKLFKSPADYQAFVKQTFATLNADGSLIPQVMAAMTDENMATLTSEMMSPAMAPTRQEMMKTIISDSDIMNTLASSKAVSSMASDKFLATMPAGTQDAITKYKKGEYDKTENPLGFKEPLQN